MTEVGLTGDELSALAGGAGVLAAAGLPVVEADADAGERSLRARGAYDDDGALVAALVPVREVLAAPGLLAQVDVEEGGRLRRTRLLATPTLGVWVRPLADGRFGVRTCAPADLLLVLQALTGLQGRPAHEGGFTTTTARLAQAAAGRGDADAPEAFLRSLLGRVRTVEVAVRRATSATRQVGCDLAWLDGGEHGLWVVPPFADGALDATPFEVRATTRQALVAELAAALPDLSAQDT